MSFWRIASSRTDPPSTRIQKRMYLKNIETYIIDHDRYEDKNIERYIITEKYWKIRSSTPLINSIDHDRSNKKTVNDRLIKDCFLRISQI